MNLAETLSGMLNTDGSISKLQEDSGTASTDMAAVSLPDMSADFNQAQTHGSGIDLSAIASGVQTALSDLGPVLSNLPAANDALAPLSSAMELISKLGELKITNSVSNLSDTFDEQLAESGDFLEKIARFSEILSGDANLQSVRELIDALAKMAGSNFKASDLKVPELVSALPVAARLVSGLMNLQTRLDEGIRLATVVDNQLKVEKITAGIAQIEKQLALDNEIPVADFLRDLDITDTDQVRVAKQAIANVSVPVLALKKSISEGMAFGEATLVHLDAGNLKQEMQEAARVLHGIDVSPLENGVQQLADKLQSALSLDLSNAPAASLDEWLTRLEDLVAELAGRITSFDVERMTAPITDGIEAVLAIPAELTKALQELKLTITQALKSIRTAVESIPVETVANAIRQVLEPITVALNFIGDFIERIQEALYTAVGALETALGSAERAVDTLKQGLDDIFNTVKSFVDGLGLEEAIGEVAQKIEDFSQLLAQADMSPYFDTVVGAIDTTTGVVDKVPFDLLPDSMEQEVVDVVRPVKQVDVDGLKDDIKDLLQIGEDGKFELRPELESALSGIQEKYDQIILTISSADPRQLLAEIDSELEDIKNDIQELTPSVALEPVQQAIDQIKEVVGGFDLNATLQPLRDGFDEVVAKVDEFKPSVLLQEVEDKLTETRDAVFGELKLERWESDLTSLRDQALALVDPLDPARLEPLLQQVVDELDNYAGNLPQLEIGHAIGSLITAIMSSAGVKVSSGSFNVVLDWIKGGDATAYLAELARTASGHIDTARNSVQQVEPNAIILQLQPAMDGIREAIETLADSETKTELLECAAVLNIELELSAFAVPRNRYLDELQQASASFLELANTGLSEVDITVTRLRNTLCPLDFVKDFFRQLLSVLGIEVDEISLQNILQSILAVATPARLAALVQPIVEALKGRVEEFLNGFINPLLNAIDDLQALKDQLSIAGLLTEMDGVHAAIREQIVKLHPDELLGETVSAFNDTQAQVMGFDPLGPINDALNALKESSVRVLDKLDPEEILKTPLEIYDDLIGALGQLDLNQLLAPILDVLDTLADKVGDGLDNTAESFSRLQDALPDQVGSTSVSASASVST